MSSSIRKYSYDVFIQLGTLSLSVRFPCKVGTIWQSFMNNLQADSKPDLIKGSSYLEQTLSNNMIMEFDTNKNAFNPKISTIKILLYTEKGVREAGQVDFDIAAVLNKRMTQMTMELKLDKCPDKNAKISFCIRMILREEVRNQVSFAAGLVSDITGGTRRSPQKIKSQAHLPPLPPLSPLQPPQHHTHYQQHQNLRNQNQVHFQNNNFAHLPQQPIVVPQINTHEPMELSANQISHHHHSVRPLVAPNIEIKITPPTPQIVVAAPVEPIETFKQERDALLLENIKLNTMLKQTQLHLQTMKNQLLQSFSEKQTLYNQLESCNQQITNLKVKNQQLIKVQEMYKQAEEELIIARTQLAKIFNAATDLGGIVLTDKLQNAIGIQQQQFPEQQPIQVQYQSQYQIQYQPQQLTQSQYIQHQHYRIVHQNTNQLVHQQQL